VVGFTDEWETRKGYNEELYQDVLAWLLLTQADAEGKSVKTDGCDQER
jgi:hypothetical protein